MGLGAQHNPCRQARPHKHLMAPLVCLLLMPMSLLRLLLMLFCLLVLLSLLLHVLGQGHAITALYSASGCGWQPGRNNRRSNVWGRRPSHVKVRFVAHLKLVLWRWGLEAGGDPSAVGRHSL